MIVGSVFSGCGLLDFGLSLAGVEHSWLCEVDEFRRTLLGRRWPHARVFDDVRAVGAHNAERVDGIVGGFPCKGASSAGKQNGFDHPETRLWREMARAVGELRPRYVVVENVANILGLLNGSVWGTVLGDLAALGYDTEWDCIPAAAFGAPHLRDRVIAVATDSDRPSKKRIADVDRESPGWPHFGRGHLAAVADSDESRADTHAAASGSRAAVGERARVASDTDRTGRVERGGQISGAAEHATAERDGAPPTNAGGGGQPQHAEQDGEFGRRFDGARWHDPLGRGVRVEWGDYEPAIRRWEAIHGPAPEPLLRRVDDRRTSRVERSRLSALGDGVQVQLGLMVGTYLMEAFAA